LRPSLLAIVALLAACAAVPAHAADPATASPAAAPAPQAAPAPTDPALEKVLEGVRKKYGSVEALSADFTQTTKSQMYGDDVQKGHVQLQRPNKMRWSFGDGDKQFVTDGKTMWVYTKADQQVIQYDDISKQRSSLDSLLGSLDKLQEQFDVTLISHDADGVVLGLKPKDDQQVKSVRLTLDGDDLVKHITITDPFDAVTEIELTNMKLGVDIPDGTFTFTPPDGVEVIDAGSM